MSCFARGQVPLTNCKHLPRQSVWAILVLAVLQQRDTYVKSVTASLASDDFNANTDVIVKAFTKVALKHVVLSADWSLSQSSDKTVRGTYKERRTIITVTVNRKPWTWSVCGRRISAKHTEVPKRVETKLRGGSNYPHYS